MALIHSHIANRYHLIRQLAAGSYAQTWLAMDLALDRNVAIKLLHSRSSSSPAETKRFLREARIAAAVSHPNIVAVFDAGAENNQPFLVMEWINGTSLKERIVQRPRINLSRVISLTTQLLDGLSAIHAMGIIHRDIKPHNVMVSESGTVKLTDFGIARLVNEADINADGMTAGSAAYMAPEQAQGLPVTPASDLYSTGVILYELLTGRLPFVGNDPHEVMRKHIKDTVVPPRRLNPAIPRELEAITLRALAKDPADRFQTADDMRYELLWSPRSVTPRRSTRTKPTPRVDWALPRFAWMAASVVLMMVMVVGATSLAVRGSSTSSDTDSTELSRATVTSEPTLTALPDPTPTGEPSWAMTMRAANEPEIALPENDEVVVQGEIQIAGVPENVSGINRPALNSDEADTDDDLVQEIASEGTGGPVAPPPPPAVDEEEDEESEEEDENDEELSDEDSEHQEGEDSQENAVGDQSDEADSENGAENDPDSQDEAGEPIENENVDDNGDGQANGNGPPDHANNDDDAPASNQQSDDEQPESTDEDIPATNQEHQGEDDAVPENPGEGHAEDEDGANYQEDAVEETDPEQEQGNADEVNSEEARPEDEDDDAEYQEDIDTSNETDPEQELDDAVKENEDNETDDVRTAESSTDTSTSI